MWVIEMVHFLILEKSSNGNSLLSDFMPRVSVVRMAIWVVIFHITCFTQFLQQRQFVQLQLLVKLIGF